MKKIFVCGLLGFFGIANIAKATNQLVTLSSNHPSYAVGDSATVAAIVNSAPSDGDYDFYLAAKLNGVPVDAVIVSNTVQLVTTSPFANSGVYDFEVDVYLENKDDANNFEASITFYSAEIGTLQDQLAHETNPTKIASLNAQIARDQSIVDSAQEQLNGIRRLVEVDHLPLNVTDATAVQLP